MLFLSVFVSGEPGSENGRSSISTRPFLGIFEGFNSGSQTEMIWFPGGALGDLGTFLVGLLVTSGSGQGGS